MSDDGNVPWPIWVLVTLLAACIGGFATIYAAREARSTGELDIFSQDSSSFLGHSPHEGEIRRTIEGGMNALELAMYKADVRPLFEFYSASALDTARTGVQKEQKDRRTGKYLASMRIHSELTALSVADPPTHARARVKIRFSQMYFDAKLGRRLPPIEETNYEVLYLKRSEGRWFIYSVEEDEEAEEQAEQEAREGAQ